MESLHRPVEGDLQAKHLKWLVGSLLDGIHEVVLESMFLLSPGGCATSFS